MFLNTKAVSLIEAMVFLALLSFFSLPLSVLLLENGQVVFSAEDSNKIQSRLYRIAELLVFFDYHEIPVGTITNTILQSKDNYIIDLTPLNLSDRQVSFALEVKELAAEFKALKSATSNKLVGAHLDAAMKKITIAVNSQNEDISIENIIIYRANL